MFIRLNRRRAISYLIFLWSVVCRGDNFIDSYMNERERKYEEINMCKMKKKLFF